MVSTSYTMNQSAKRNVTEDAVNHVTAHSHLSRIKCVMALSVVMVWRVKQRGVQDRGFVYRWPSLKEIKVMVTDRQADSQTDRQADR